MQLIQQVMTDPTQAANTTSIFAKPRAAAATTPAPASSTNSTSSAGGATASTASDSMLTSNDFLTLLVSEMKNQDPTQPTDPTTYITQMAQINSLQQLVGINQGVTSLDTAAGVSATGSTSGVSGS